MLFFQVICATAIILNNYSSVALKILGIIPLPVKSHFAPVATLMKELANRGHQVDVVSYFPMEKPIANYRDIPLNNSTDLIGPTNNMSYKVAMKQARVYMGDLSYDLGSSLCLILSHKVFQNLLKLPKGAYDAVVIEFSLAYCFAAFGEHFNASVIGMVVSNLPDWLYQPMKIPINTAYMPSLISSFTSDMTFLQRLVNTLWFTVINLQVNYFVENQRELVEKYFGRKLSSIHELFHDISLILINSHHSLGTLRPTQPGVVEVGGLHVLNNDQKLSLEMKKWLDDSEHGCVYISFGSMIRIETFPRDFLEAFYAMFRRIRPLRVLMKVANASVLPQKLPKNVKTSPWLPQIAVLRHKNVQVFVTHGGFIGAQEAIAASVPMVGIPIVFDEFSNIAAYTMKNIAVSLNVHEVNADSLTKAVNTVLRDPKYKVNMKKISKLFHDRPMSAIDTAVYWVEYVVKHGNVFQSTGSRLNFWQYYLIDVYGFIIFFLFGIIYMIIQLFNLFKQIFYSFFKLNGIDGVKKNN